MSTMSSFDNGVAAMMAHSIAMDGISQNIANLRTPGYRRSDTTFSTVLAGVDVGPYKAGGVRPEVRTLVDVQGPIESSNRPMDLAINGRGFFIYSSEPTGAGDIYYSRQASLIGANVDPEGAVGSYLSAFEGLHLMAWEVGPTGAPIGGTLDAMVAIPASLNDPFPGRATSRATLTAEIPAFGSSEAVTDILYYDAAGNEQSMTLRWTNTGINAWDLNFYDSSGALIDGPEPMTFDGDGNISSTALLTPGGLFSLDMSYVSQRGEFFYRGLYTQDGLAAGEFIDYQIDQSGLISGRFESGAVSPLYQLALANFANPNGLLDQGNNLWVEGEKSGAAEYVSSGELSVILSGATELSNVDLGDAFSQLIVTQRAYSSAAQLVRTADEMSETARDLKS